jgi:DNA repair protein RadC
MATINKSPLANCPLKTYTYTMMATMQKSIPLPDDRPREKLYKWGCEQLSDAELLALLLQCGNKQRSAMELASELLAMAKHNLSELARMHPLQMARIKGIGKARAAQVMAALELGRRRHAGPPLLKTQVCKSSDIARFLQISLQDRQQEVFGVLYLNRANRINHFEIVSEGGITGTVADPRIILKKALEQNAVSIIVCHNHPSGNLQPSRADEQLTQRLKEAAQLLDIHMLDHVIVSEQGYYSFADEGLI